MRTGQEPVVVLLNFSGNDLEAASRYQKRPPHRWRWRADRSLEWGTGPGLTGGRVTVAIPAGDSEYLPGRVAHDTVHTSREVERASSREGDEDSDSTTPRLHHFVKIGDDPGRRRALRCLHLDCLVVRCGRRRTGDRGAVREAIAALGYRPNLLARSFRRRVTHTIGLLVPDNSNPFFAELARTIEDAASPMATASFSATRISRRSNRRPTSMCSSPIASTA